MADAILRKLSKLRIKPGDVILVHDAEIFRKIKNEEESGRPVFPLPVVVLHVPAGVFTKLSYEEQAEIFIKAADSIREKQEKEAEARKLIETPRPPDEPLVKLVSE